MYQRVFPLSQFRHKLSQFCIQLKHSKFCLVRIKITNSRKRRFEFSPITIQINCGPNDANLENICGTYLSANEKKFLFPILVKLAGSEQNALIGLIGEPIPAFANQTGLELLKNNQSYAFIKYINHINQSSYS